MLQRTFSFWQRLVGGQPPPAPAAAQEERRLWVRYPADLPTNVQLSGSAPARFAGQVRDISLGGAHLIVEHAVPAGQMIRLELPALEEGCTQDVLACVVRAAPEGERWALGCVFSRELSADDLRGLGADKIPPASEDQRAWMRFPTQVQARFQVSGQEEAPFQNARVLNISASGIGLVLEECVEAGTLLTLELGRADQAVRTILACVVHVTAHSGGVWSLGCNFIRQLDEADLQALMASVEA